MNKSKIISISVLIIAISAGIYLYNKYNIAPKIDLSKLEIIDQDTNIFEISSLKGKKIIVNFYASWCPNCIEELAVLNKIKSSKLNDVEILAITDESLEKLIWFKNKKQYPFIFMKLNDAFPNIGIHSIPVTYLLNTKGEVVYEKVGYIAWDDDSNIEYLKQLMD